MILRNDNELIGDFIGTIPAMIALAGRGPIEVIIQDSVAELFDMIPARYGITRSVSAGHDMSIDLHGAFAYADRERLHMTQAHFHTVGLPVPSFIPRPQLEVSGCNAPAYDFVLAPFSRSLPPEQFWPSDRWQALVDGMPGKCFALLGNQMRDDPHFISGPNVDVIFSKPMSYVTALLNNSTGGLVSVVTGISHLAHALGVRNYLFVNQGPWGKNPDAIYFDKHIPDILVEEIIHKLQL